MNRPGRPLGLPSTTSLVVASMIGAGVYSTSGFALADLGSRYLVITAWGLAGLVALCGAISYGALAREIGESGGEYVFLTRRVHPLAGFLAGWVSLLAGFSGAIAFAALALESYTLPVLPWELPPGWLAAVVIAGCVLLHALHVRFGAGMQNSLVALKLFALVGLVLYGTWCIAFSEAIDLERGEARWSWLAFANTLTWISLSYSGFNAAVYVFDEVDKPDKTVPRSLVWGTLLVTVLYLAVNAMALWSGPVEQIAGKEDVVAVAAGLLGGRGFAAFARAVIIASLATSVSAMVMSGPRVYAKMAADRLFPVPLPSGDKSMTAAVLLQGGLAMALVFLATLRELLDYLGFMLSVSAAGAVATLFVIAHREGEHFKRPYGYPFTPAFFVGATLLFGTMTALRRPGSCATAAAATIASGCLLYAWLRWNEKMKDPA